MVDTRYKLDRHITTSSDVLFFALFCEERINGADTPFEGLPLLDGKGDAFLPGLFIAVRTIILAYVDKYLACHRSQ